MMIVILTDVHLAAGTELHPSYLAAKEFIKANKPDQIIIGGDFLDFSYISKYAEEFPMQKENKRLYLDKDLAVEEIKFMKKYSKNVVYCEGNHEFRLQKTLEALPIFETMIELPNLLALDQLKIQFVPEAKQPFKIFDKLYFLHGKRMGKYYAAQILDDYVGVSVIQGHCHRPMQFSKSNNLTGAIYTGVGLGCLTELHQSYENGRPTGHCNGFGVIEGNNDLFSIHNVVMENNKFIYNGKLYQA